MPVTKNPVKRSVTDIFGNNSIIANWTYTLNESDSTVVFVEAVQTKAVVASQAIAALIAIVYVVAQAVQMISLGNQMRVTSPQNLLELFTFPLCVILILFPKQMPAKVINQVVLIIK